LVKYNSSGVAQWAKTYTSAPANGGGDFYGVTLDSSGNVYVVGRTTSVAGTYNFGNSVSINALHGTDNTSAVIVKYDSSGTPQTANSPTGTNNDSFFNGVAVDSSNNIYVAGGIKGNVGFIFGGGYTATGSNSGGSAVVVKYNSSLAASSGQVATNAGTGCCNYNGVAVDSGGNIYLVGMTSIATIDFGNGVPTITGTVPNDSGMVVKLNSSFVAQWAKVVIYQTVGVAVDSSSNVYVATRTDNNVRTFSGLNYTGTAAGGANAVLLKLNGADGVGVWLRSNTTATAWTNFVSVSVDSSNNIYATGWGYGTGNIDFGSGVVNGGSITWNAVLVKYDTAGTNLSTKIQTSASSDSWGFGVFANSSGVYVSGYATDTKTFTFDTGKTFTGKATGENPYWIKY
jgi:hypothetical protein